MPNVLRWALGLIVGALWHAAELAEVLQEVQGVHGIAELSEGVVHELLQRFVDRSDVVTELGHRGLPQRLVQ